MFIERPPQWYRLLFPGAVFRMPQSNENPGKVYLTFDDGPIPEATPQILDLLDKYEVKATFFMVGQNVERYPRLLHDVIERGHKVGNHTLHHIRGFGIKSEDYVTDMESCHPELKKGLFRPPHGWLSPSQLKKIKEKYKVIMYDLVTRDYSKRVSAEEVTRNVKKYARDGSIIVFHDSIKSIGKLQTALPESIDWLQKQGYKFGLL